MSTEVNPVLIIAGTVAAVVLAIVLLSGAFFKKSSSASNAGKSSSSSSSSSTTSSSSNNAKDDAESKPKKKKAAKKAGSVKPVDVEVPKPSAVPETKTAAAASAVESVAKKSAGGKKSKKQGAASKSAAPTAAVAAAVVTIESQKNDTDDEDSDDDIDFAAVSKATRNKSSSRSVFKVAAPAPKAAAAAKSAPAPKASEVPAPVVPAPAPKPTPAPVRAAAPIPAPAPAPVQATHSVVVDDHISSLLLSENQAIVDDWAVVEVKKPKNLKKSSDEEQEGTVPSTNGATTATAPVVAASTAAAPSVEQIPAETFVADPPAPVIPVDKVTEEISIPAKKVGAIIGVKGAVKLAIQVACDAEINLPKVAKESTLPVTATITGPAEGVKKAKKAIQDLVTKGYSSLLEGEDFRETQVNVHYKYLPDIIGKGGVNIRAIQDSLQVKVTIPPTPAPSSSILAGTEVKSTVKIGVCGLKDNVIRAKALIKELIQFYHTEITHPGVVHEELDIPTYYYSYIIGLKGSEIKHIQAFFKVSVHIPNDDSINKNVVVVGLPDNVDKAKKYILKTIQNLVDGVRTKGAKTAVIPEDEVVDVTPADLEVRPSEVSFEDLIQTAKHVQVVHIHNANSSSVASSSAPTTAAFDEASSSPILENSQPVSAPVVANAWNGNVLGASTAAVAW